jgi:hypothetical protein
MSEPEELQEAIRRIEGRLGITPNEVIRWFGAKTPEGLLVLAIAFDIAIIGLWILSYAAKNFGLI